MKNIVKKHQNKFLILICGLICVLAFMAGRQLGVKTPETAKKAEVKKEQTNDSKELAEKEAAEIKAAEKAAAEKEAEKKAAEKKLAQAEAQKNAAKAEAKQKQAEAEKAKKAAKEMAEKRNEKAEAEKKKAKELADKKAKESKKDTGELPDVSADDWQLLLINSKNPLKSEKVDLETLSNGYQVDKRIAGDFEDFEKAANDNGINFVIVSSYRSVSDQKTVFDNSVKEHLNSGASQKEAEKLTREYITVPGTSEHHTGLAIDVIDEKWSKEGKGLEDSFYDTKAGKWIDQHAADYGFVIRYPADKEKVTSINYEPWHLRYVGKENARYMKEHNLVLEEYLALLKK